jgi:hypothetical protein
MFGKLIYLLEAFMFYLSHLYYFMWVLKLVGQNNWKNLHIIDEEPTVSSLFFCSRKNNVN